MRIPWGIFFGIEKLVKIGNSVLCIFKKLERAPTWVGPGLLIFNSATNHLKTSSHRQNHWTQRMCHSSF